MTHTTFKEKPVYISETKEAIKKLKDNFQQIELAFTESGGVLKKDSYHLITRILKPHNRIERTLYAIIYQLAYKAEIRSAGAGVLTVAFSLAILEQLLKQQTFLSLSNERELVGIYQKRAQEIVKDICLLSNVGTREQITQTLKDVCGDDKTLAKVLDAAVDMAGLEGNIRIEESKQSCYVVEMKYGYSFNLVPYKMFFNQQTNLWESRNVKVFLLDGMVEKVSELENLLNKTIQTKQPMVIIAQGFAEEVIATLKINNDKGVFNIIPLKLQPDLAGLNILNDIASVVGSDVLSTLKGELITFADYSLIPSVDHVLILNDVLTIQNQNTRARVALQIKMLLEKRNAPQTVQDVCDLYDKRITSLLSHAVIIKLPSMSELANQNVRVKIDTALRMVKTVASNGVVDFEKIVKMYEKDEIFGEALVATLKTLEEHKIMPTLSACAGFYFAGQTMLTLMSTAGLVEIVS